MIKPLDGSPFISDNCWQAILDAMDLRAGLGNKIRCLEWGSGNSTIAFVKKGLTIKAGLDLISIDHATPFFPWLVEAILKELKIDDKNKKLRVSWWPLNGPTILLSNVKRVLRERQVLACAVLKWQILLESKRLQYTEQIKPNFNVPIIKMLKQAIIIGLLELGYWSWLLMGVWRGLKSKVNSYKPYQLDPSTFNLDGERVESNLFFEHFCRQPAAGCLKIQLENIYIELWHLPEPKTVFWNKGLVLDGAITQLQDYVCVPLEDKFDIIFIDGRARVSCAKRVKKDNLLKRGGWLFMHDAFRSEMSEAFQLFNKSLQFINGSNRMLNGQKRCNQPEPPLMQTGSALNALREEVAQELFVYQNQ